MQVLLRGCQIPPFRLRWLQIVWSIGERASHQWIAGEVLHHIWDGSSLYAHAGIIVLTIWYISTFAFSTRNHLIFTGFQLAFISSPSHITLAHITQSRSNVWCVQVMSLPVCFLAAIQGVVCSHSYRSQHSVTFFIYAWQLYPFPLALLVGCVEWKTCEGDIKWPIQTSEVYIKWAFQVCEVYISCLNVVIM